MRTHRSIKIDGREAEFSDGFGDLYTETHRGVMAGRGFGLQDVRPAVEMAHGIRNAALAPSDQAYHPPAASVETA